MSSRSCLATLAGASVFAWAGVVVAQSPAASDGGPTAAPTSPVEHGAPAAEGGVTPTAEASPGEPSGGGLFEQSVSAASGSGAPAPAASAFQLGGYTRGDVFIGKVPGFRQGNIKAGYGELALIARSKKETVGDAFAEVRLRYGMLGEAQQQSTVDVREAYVNAYLGRLDLRLGKQIIVWGRADLLNPTNNLTPVDFRMRSPVEDDRRIGNVGARAFLRLSPVRLEGVWLPAYAPTELPPVNLPTYVSYGTPNYPKAELDRGLLAGRAHLELAAVDMSVSYLHGYAPMPGLALTSVKIDPNNPQIILARTAYKQQVVGFDFSTAFRDIVAIRGEVAYRRPYNDQNLTHAPKPDLQYALGADHTFGSVSVIAQYLGRYAFDWKKATVSGDSPNPEMIKAEYSAFLRQSAENVINAQLARTNQILFSQTEKVQHLGTVRVEWLTAHDTLSLSAVGMVNFTTKEWLASPKIGYRMSDSLIAYVGAEILTGPTGTLFGLIDQQLSAGYFELRSTF